MEWDWNFVWEIIPTLIEGVKITILATILGSPTLRGQISTVDDLDLAQGPTTAILTLLAAQAGEIGRTDSTQGHVGRRQRCGLVEQVGIGSE